MIKGCLILALGLWIGWQVHTWKSNHDSPPGREAYVWICLHNEGEVIMGKNIVMCHAAIPEQ